MWSGISAFYWPQDSTSQFLQQCEAHRHTPQHSFTILPSSFFQGAHATDAILSRTCEDSTPKPHLSSWDTINMNTQLNQLVSKTASQVEGDQIIHYMTNNLTETQEWDNRLNPKKIRKPRMFLINWLRP